MATRGRSHAALSSSSNSKFTAVTLAFKGLGSLPSHSRSRLNGGRVQHQWRREVLKTNVTIELVVFSFKRLPV